MQRQINNRVKKIVTEVIFYRSKTADEELIMSKSQQTRGIQPVLF